MTEQSEGVGMVRLPGGWLVRERFEATVPLLSPPEMTAPRVSKPGLNATVGIVMVGTRPHVAYITVYSDGDRVFPVETFADLPLVAVIDLAIQAEAREHTPLQKISLAELEEVPGAVLERVRRESVESFVAVRAARRHKVTPELLRRVLELHEKGGIALVMDELNNSERNARRLLARARKELQ